jgi:hypothetical protein
MALVLRPLDGFHGEMHTSPHYNKNSVLCLAIPGRLTPYCTDSYHRHERLCDRCDERSAPGRPKEFAPGESFSDNLYSRLE